MPCLKCHSDNLLISQSLEPSEQVGVLTASRNFVMCHGCGNVMMTSLNGGLIETDHITDERVIRLSFEKLFADQTKKPYGYAQTLEQMPTKIGSDWETSLAEADAQYAIIEQKEAVVPVDSAPEEIVDLTYTHVDKSLDTEHEEKLGLFGRLFNSIKNLFKRAS